MKRNPASGNEGRPEEIAAWILKLQEAQNKLQELTGGAVDAVLDQEGKPYLLLPAQENLQQSESRQRHFATTLQAILNALPAHIALLNTDGMIISVNEAWQSFGLAGGLQSSDFFVNQNYIEICERVTGECAAVAHASRVGKLGAWAAEYPGPRLKWSEEVYRIHEVAPDFQPDHESTLNFFLPDSRRKIEAAITSQKPYDLELEIMTAKGNRRWVRSTSAIEMENGQVRRLYGVFQDFTERKQAEARIRRLVDSQVQGVFFWKVSGEITDSNDAFLKIVGYTREDLMEGRVSWAEMTPPEYAEDDRRALEEIAEKGFCSSYEKVYLRKDGTRIPVLIGAAIFEDNPTEGICFALNLTERNRMEARMRRLVDSNVQGVMFWNRNGEISEANDRFLEIVGYSRGDLQAGRINWKALTAQEYMQADQRAMDEVDEKGTCTPYEKEYIRKDGSRIPVLIGSASFEDNPDEGVRFVLDLTERKKLEQQFLRAQRMESIGTLAGGVAHDLNNILAPIMMSIDLLKSMVTNPQGSQMLATIEVSARQGADIVRQVLSFARGLESERIEIQPKHLLLDLENIIKGTFPKNIELEFGIPDGIWTIWGDPTQVNQVLLNLCVNARDAMPNGGKLSVEVENCVLDEHYAAMSSPAKSGHYVQINVTDSGSGMSKDVIDKIFDPFFTTKEICPGVFSTQSTPMSYPAFVAGRDRCQADRQVAGPSGWWQIDPGYLH